MAGTPARRAGRLAIFAHMFRPPPRFEPALEAEFRAEGLRRWARARTAAVALLALIWISYFGWDYFHGYRNQDFRPALDWIFPERTARAAFTRERALTDRNARMETAQRETRAKTAALVKAKDELRALAEQQNIAKSKFLADAAHDLRQPMQALTNLLGAARHALGQGDAAKADEVLALAQDASRLTRTSFNAVLDISRLESGFVEAELGDVDLPSLVEEAAALCRADAEERGVTLRLRWRGDRPIVVRSDRHLLGRVIGNLLANAVKYSDPGKAKAGRAAVVVGIVCLPSRVRIDIVDNGVGIAEGDWARVFRPFVQLGNDERDREKGVGLG